MEQVKKNVEYCSPDRHFSQVFDLLSLQNLECVLQDVVTENAGLQQQLQSSRQQLTRKEAELTREQQHIQEMKQQVCIYMYVKAHLHVWLLKCMFT